jgi:hypothetical protein
MHQMRWMQCMRRPPQCCEAPSRQLQGSAAWQSVSRKKHRQSPLPEPLMWRSVCMLACMHAQTLMLTDAHHACAHDAPAAAA